MCKKINSILVEILHVKNSSRREEKLFSLSYIQTPIQVVFLITLITLMDRAADKKLFLSLHYGLHLCSRNIWLKFLICFWIQGKHKVILSVLTFDVHICLNTSIVNRQRKGFLGMTGPIVKQAFPSEKLNQTLNVPFCPPLLTARFGCLIPKTCIKDSWCAMRLIPRE